MILSATTHALELVTSTTSAINYVVSWTDIDKSAATATTPGSNQGATSSATDTTIVAAPGASVYRVITSLTLVNTGAAANVVTVQKDVSGTEHPVTPATTLQPGESLTYEDGAGWRTLDKNGRLKTTATDRDAGTTGYPVPVIKVGTASEAAGVWYSHAKDGGMPGSWAPGTPGVAGRATDGTTSNDAGCLSITTPGSGGNYLVGYVATSSVAHLHALMDVLWVNSGLTVTTATAQTVDSATWPARDLDGATSGRGVMVGILVVTATTNAGGIANTTMSYTNSAGTPGQTATTVGSFPATAVAGTVVWFQLAAGDAGVQSIQSVTLGTSYGGGAISLIAAVPLVFCPVTLIHVGGAGSSLGSTPAESTKTGVRLYPGVCALPMYLSSATTATNTHALATIEVR